MTTSEIEKRFTVLERDMAELRAHIQASAGSGNEWVEEVAGTFSTTRAAAALDKATRLGRKWRELQGPKARKPRVRRNK